MSGNGIPVTRRQFSLESARQAAYSGQFSNAVQSYLIVLPSLSPGMIYFGERKDNLELLELEFKLLVFF